MEGLRTQDINPDSRIVDEKFESLLANQLADLVKKIDFGENRTMEAISEMTQAIKVHEAGLGRDSRATLETTEQTKSLFEGLDFDEEKLRSQVFVLQEGENPIAVMTFEIAPPSYINSLRYFKKTPKGLKIVDFNEISGGLSPTFMIIPAWTETIPEKRAQLSIAKNGLGAFDKIMETLVLNAPEGTVIESVAQGKAVDIAEGEDKQVRFERHKRVKEASSKELGTIIPYDQLPFSMEDFGLNGAGSSSTVKNALRVGLEQVTDVASDGSLGPVFIKSIESRRWK